MKTEKFIQDLKSKVYCRVGVSQIHGVGVFAIRTIPKGINPMQGRDCEFIEIPVPKIKDDPHIPNNLKKLVVDMCPEEGGIYYCPPFSMNDIGIAWYLNHSKTPNMEERDGDFYSLREISEGDELTVDYGTYGELNL